MSKITTEKYDPVRIERIRHFLESSAEKGKPKFFEIFVDNLKAVEKTDDTACFDEYKMYVDENTQMIKILIYTSTENCPRNDKFIFSLHNPKEDKRQEQLNGLDIQNKIDTAIQQERDRNQVMQLQKELQGIQEQLTESEEYADMLQERLQNIQQEYEDYKKKRIGLAEMNTGKLVGFATDYLIKSHPVLAQKLPIVSTLSGLLMDESTLPEPLNGLTEPAAQGNASFNRKTPEAATPQHDVATENKLHFFRQMEEAFTEPQLETVISVIQGLAAKPDLLNTIHELVYNEVNKAKKKA